ncbi:8986_t:CDS:2 [Funneliformis caledonium]|uniref:8986_t:CDS:1 n=1 Tax=Funneliformis caledonium TaxID=1117310 RepID=A0A9N9CVM5_9GLOM|nr:8986_t:CDS:2 [Funneliformis caledonium]
MADILDVNEKKRKCIEDETKSKYRDSIKRVPNSYYVVNRPIEALSQGLKADSDNKLNMKNIEFDQYIDDENFIQEKLLLNNSYILETIYFSREKYFLLFTSYQSEALQMRKTSDYQPLTNIC